MYCGTDPWLYWIYILTKVDKTTTHLDKTWKANEKFIEKHQTMRYYLVINSVSMSDIQMKTENCAKIIK